MGDKVNHCTRKMECPFQPQYAVVPKQTRVAGQKKGKEGRSNPTALRGGKWGEI